MENSFKTHAFQDMILNDNHDRICLVIARQTGKSTVAAVKAIHSAYWNENSLVVVISSTKDQAKELLHRMHVFIRTSKYKILTHPQSRDSKHEIKLRNANKKTYSRIISVPATDAARGYSPNEVILDEADFIENGEYFFKHVVLPMVQNTKGKISILTTPNPHKRGGYVYEISKSEDWNVYQFGWTANPTTTEKEIEKLKKMMTISEFRCEYEAQFPTGENSFFKESLIEAAVDKDCELEIPKGNVVGSVDFGKINDQCIIYLGYAEGVGNEQIVKVWKRIVKPLGTDYSAIMAEIRHLTKTYGVYKWYLDATGVGEAPADILKNDGINVEPIKFSLQSKADMYGYLKLLFEQKRIRIPDVPELKEQLIMMEHEYLGYNKLKIHHPIGGHDDECDALVLMAYGFTSKSSGVEVIYTDKPKKEKKKIVTRKAITCKTCERYAYSSNPESGYCDSCG